MADVPLLLPPPPCSAHATEAASTTCAGCGRFLCAGCAAPSLGEPVAQARDAGVDAASGASGEPAKERPPVPEGPPAGPRCATCKGAGHPIPWEDPKVPAAAGLWRTLKLLPSDSFHSSVPWTGGLGLPLRFAAASATIGALGAAAFGVVSAFMTVALLDALRGVFLAHPDPTVRQAFLSMIDLVRGLAGPDKALLGFAVAMLQPVMIVLQVLVISALTQPIARALGGQGTFEGTLRAIAYAQGALVLKAVPLVGGSIAFLAVILVAYLGLRRAHGLSGGRALIAATWWIPVQLALVGVLAVLVFARIAPMLVR